MTTRSKQESVAIVYAVVQQRDEGGAPHILWWEWTRQQARQYIRDEMAEVPGVRVRRAKLVLFNS